MTKLEKLQRCLEYKKVINNTVSQNKQKDNNIFVRLLHTFSQNVFAVLGLTLLTFLGVGFALVAFTNFTLPVLFGISLGSALTAGVAIPKLLDLVAMNVKTRFGLKYCKKFMNSYFDFMKEFTEKDYKNLLKAKNENQVTDEELDSFINQTEIFAKKYYCYLNKVIGKKIFKRNKSDYNKIEKVSNSKLTEKQKETKISKIINKNNLALCDWIDIYNNCGIVAKNLYKYAYNLNNEFGMPKDSNFFVDKDYLNNKKTEILSSQQFKVFSFNDKEENVTFSNPINVSNNSQNKVKKEEYSFEK